MRKLALGILVLAIALVPIGCTIIIVYGNTSATPSTSGSVAIGHDVGGRQADIDDVRAASSVQSNVLVDVPSGFTYDPTNPPQAVVTVTTDTGVTSSQSFALTPADASSFTPAAPNTLTFAFAAQAPSALTSFIQSATSQATSTVNVDIKSTIGFQGPTDGRSYTAYGRDYNPYSGIHSDGSATFTTPVSSGGGQCRGGHCPLQ